MKFNPGNANLNQMMKQAKKMQQQLEQAKAEAEEKVISASAGGGAITLEMNGRQEVLSLTLKPEVVDPEDLDMLQDLIIAAVNDAIKTSQEMVSSEITKITGGFNLPGL